MAASEAAIELATVKVLIAAREVLRTGLAKAMGARDALMAEDA